MTLVLPKKSLEELELVRYLIYIYIVCGRQLFEEGLGMEVSTCSR